MKCRFFYHLHYLIFKNWIRFPEDKKIYFSAFKWSCSCLTCLFFLSGFITPRVPPSLTCWLLFHCRHNTVGAVVTFQRQCDGCSGDCSLAAHPLVIRVQPSVEPNAGVLWHLAFHCKNYRSLLTSNMHKIHDLCGTACRCCSRRKGVCHSWSTNGYICILCMWLHPKKKQHVPVKNVDRQALRDFESHELHVFPVSTPFIILSQE